MKTVEGAVAAAREPGWRVALLGLAASALCPATAPAAIVTDYFDFSASDFFANSGDFNATPPVGLVEGNVEISFDDADVEYFTPISATVLSLNVPYTTPVQALFLGYPVIGIGFTSAGASSQPQLPFFQLAFSYSSPTVFSYPGPTPDYGYFAYAPGDGAEFQAQDVLVTQYTVTPDPGGSSVPEPAAWVVLLTGLGAVGAMLRSSFGAASIRTMRSPSMRLALPPADR